MNIRYVSTFHTNHIIISINHGSLAQVWSRQDEKPSKKVGSLQLNPIWIIASWDFIGKKSGLSSEKKNKKKIKSMKTQIYSV